MVLTQKPGVNVVDCLTCVKRAELSSAFACLTKQQTALSRTAREPASPLPPDAGLVCDMEIRPGADELGTNCVPVLWSVLLIKGLCLLKIPSCVVICFAQTILDASV